jgi:hypothetical protein
MARLSNNSFYHASDVETCLYVDIKVDKKNIHADSHEAHMGLCLLCQDVFVEPVRLIANGGTFKHHDIVGLQSSVADGCHLCSIFWNDMRRAPRRVLRLRQEVQQAERALKDQIVVIVAPLHAGDVRSHCRLMAFLDDPDARHQVAGCWILFEKSQSLDEAVTNQHVQNYPVANITSLSTGSPESLEQAARWIRACVETHTTCGRQEPAKKPSRLLQVEQSNGMVRLRLREDGEIAENAIYATLSHCWGEHLSLKLFQDEYDTFKALVSFADLPRTFQEAVYVTMYLGIPYIWIDALCIIQDSQQDWAREAALMSEVYANALVNLAATASSDSSGGLFRFREPLSIIPCRVSLKDGHEVILYSTRTGIDILNSPLNSRGWVLQERILATRQLSFTEDSIHWECNSVRACEQLPVRMLPDEDWTDLKAWKSALASLRSDKNERKFTSMWMEIVQQYTNCDLTFESDKLIAIAGIAKWMGHEMGLDSNEYFGGIWRPDFLRQLLWYLFDPGVRSETYRAPSWSWASIDGSLQTAAKEFESGKDFEVAHLINIRTEHDGNPFGMLKGGFCCIQGPMAHLELTYVFPHDQDSNEESNGKQMASINEGEAFETRLWEFQADEGIDVQIENGRWHREHSNHIVLQLFQDQDRAHGLVLEATEEEGQFRRWGVFNSTREVLVTALRESVQTTHRQDDLPGEYCHGCGYTVMIV